MEIVQSNRELTKVEQYRLTKAPNIKKMSSMKGQRIEFEAWCIYLDNDKDGNQQQLVSILTPEGEAFATNSKTFLESFEDLVDIFGNEFTAIEVCTGTSKAGREYITATYAD